MDTRAPAEFEPEGIGERLRDAAKGTLGRTLCAAGGRCRFDRAVFVLAHMRCGSTALSNVLCSRPEISGYGEAHVRYRRRADLGRLIANQARRGAWRPRANFLFDKILHSRHDRDAPPEFFEARALFLCRRPEEAIPSIRRLFEGLGHGRYRSEDEAAAYYAARLDVLAALWDRFPPERRIGLTYDALLADPDGALARVSRLLSLDPPLENRYRSHAASTRGGGGDPTRAGALDRIRARRGGREPEPLRLDPARRAAVMAAYRRFARRIAADAA